MRSPITHLMKPTSAQAPSLDGHAVVGRTLQRQALRQVSGGVVALNSDQAGRTFQDRSYVFRVAKVG